MEEGKIELRFGVGLFDRLEIEDEIFKDYLIFNTRRRGELEIFK